MNRKHFKIGRCSVFILAALVVLFSGSANAYRDVGVNITNVSTAVLPGYEYLLNVAFDVINYGEEALQNVNVTVYYNDLAFNYTNIPEVGAGGKAGMSLNILLDRSVFEHEITVTADFDRLLEDRNMFDNFDTYTYYLWWYGVNLVVGMEMLDEKAFVNESVPIQISVKNTGLLNATNVSVNLSVNGEELYADTMPVPSFYFSDYYSFGKTLTYIPQEDGLYAFNLTVLGLNASEAELYYPDNTAALSFRVGEHREVNFTVTGNKEEVLVKIRDDYSSGGEMNRTAKRVDTEPQPIEVVESATDNIVIFNNSVPADNMSIEFKIVGDKTYENRQLYSVYAFEPSWSYSDLRVEFNTYPDIAGLVVYGCRSWDWTNSKCSTNWIALNTASGSIIGYTDENMEAVALGLLFSCGNGVCEQSGGESSGNCPADCRVPVTVDAPAGGAGCGGGGCGGAPANLTVLSGQEKQSVGGPVLKKNESNVECAEEGRKVCANDSLQVCGNGRMVVYECFYGCENSRCIEVSPHVSEQPVVVAVEPETVILLVAVSAILAGFVALFLYWKMAKKKKQARSRKSRKSGNNK